MPNPTLQVGGDVGQNRILLQLVEKSEFLGLGSCFDLDLELSIVGNYIKALGTFFQRGDSHYLRVTITVT